jgi:ABC-type branched-subunit amino acid transport system substrate-binding protein
MRRKNLVRSAAVGLAFVLVAAACGDDSDSDSAATTAGAATTAAAAATTAAAADTTAAAGGETLQVDAASCPPEATTALADGEDIVIGITVPLTGPLAAFGAIPQGMTVYFDKVNAAGGVDGHNVVLISKDDAYDPNKTPPLVTELIEQDKMMASLLQVGTPNVAATRALYEESCTPQLYVGTGFPAWGDPTAHPWTMGGILAYNTEAVMWADFLAEEKPGATVAQLVFNNDFGKAYQTTFEAIAPEKGLEVVETQLHEGTATAIDNEITTLLAANPDVIIGETTGAFCPKLFAGLAAGGFDGIVIISATCASVASFFKPVDPAGNGVYILGQQKDPSDPQWADDPPMVEYKADMAEFGASLDANNGQHLTGYNLAALMVDTLERAAALDGGLTRANVMNAAWATNFKVPLILGGTFHVDGITDAYGAEFAAMLQYDAATGSLKATGLEFDVEGKTGVFEAS